VIRGFPEVVEFRTTVSQTATMRSLVVEIEVAPGGGDSSALGAKVSQRLREALGLSVSVTMADAGTLPRFDMKARRFVVEG
jgi:phenylacetate-CoA ligase